MFFEKEIAARTKFSLAFSYRDVKIIGACGLYVNEISPFPRFDAFGINNFIFHFLSVKKTQIIKAHMRKYHDGRCHFSSEKVRQKSLFSPSICLCSE